jgi:hypothetical protein
MDTIRRRFAFSPIVLVDRFLFLSKGEADSRVRTATLITRDLLPIIGVASLASDNKLAFAQICDTIGVLQIIDALKLAGNEHQTCGCGCFRSLSTLIF